LFIGGPLLNWLLIVPLLGSSVQNGINGLVDAAGVQDARDAGAFLVQTELKWRSRQRVACGVYLVVLASVHLAIVSLALFADRQGGGKLDAAVQNFCFISFPLVVGAMALFVRAGLMALRRNRLNANSRQTAAIVAAERRTTMLYQLVWSGVFAVIGFAIVGMLIFGEWSRSGFDHYSLIESVLPPFLIFVLPAWVTVLYLLTRVYQAVTSAPAAATPVLGLQSRPTPIWPALACAAVALLLLGTAGVWIRLDRAILPATGASVIQRPLEAKPQVDVNP
jgi:hypothetical protein